MSGSVFALVDCNNFYASCETLFQPKYRGSPIVVLSNNDGCVVARSKEAKLLGIKMGVPFHQISAMVKQKKVVVFSSNYALYGDLSHRVMSVLGDIAPDVEVYSTDEAFLSLAGMERNIDLVAYGQAIRERVQNWTGITVCVGISTTKTLAKLANHAAKAYPATGGVVDLTDRHRQRKLLALTPVGDVWGVGRQLSIKLHDLNIHTALDLAEADLKTLRKQFSVVLERTARELNGESCLALEDVVSAKKQIVCSRSFGTRVEELTQLREAVSSYTARASVKLRASGQLAKQVTVSVRTGAFNQNETPYNNMASTTLAVPTDDSSVLCKVANSLLGKIWRPGYRYAKAGVMLSDLYGKDTIQEDLFSPQGTADRAKLMATLDNINKSRHGQVFLAAQGIKQRWAMHRDYLSPSYTTQWCDIPLV
ncbi:translesion error-prone DNA polymerase V subunit UmuC [Zhongshania sp.]|uniref:translesion error-prone DNA polymerase V subunit UmuC n=1 Tax=Zhongshania sp. TaxID=1971902 RepID=UPI00356B30E0